MFVLGQQISNLDFKIETTPASDLELKKTSVSCAPLVYFLKFSNPNISELIFRIMILKRTSRHEKTDNYVSQYKVSTVDCSIILHQNPIQKIQ
jgi:hypothetical protein